ncbi:MAG: GDP-mannose 4,6-dehydratase [Candidatus Tantalella remota]|nr:GDP-mannose 4,6-dehydratase [Candidatus Tantalella remota]
MAKKKALITGITGQDGSYLAEYLIGLGYEVHGLVMEADLADPENLMWRVNGFRDELNLHCGSLESYTDIFKIVDEVKPDELYHLAAFSFVSYNFDDEFSIMNVNVNGTHYVLSALHNICPDCRVYFASSSEMFGRAEETPQRETTTFHPRSIYGISKVAGFHLARNYREAYNMFALSGILYNHESPRRGIEYVTRKITSSAVRIKLGLQDKLCLGNLDARRDWGHAAEYVKVMHMMLQQPECDDYVVGTGKTHSVREFADLAFKVLDMKYKDHVEVDQEFHRKAETELLVADAGKIKKKLGWEYTLPFEDLVTEMVEADYEFFSKKK